MTKSWIARLLAKIFKPELKGKTFPFTLTFASSLLELKVGNIICDPQGQEFEIVKVNEDSTVIVQGIDRLVAPSHIKWLINIFGYYYEDRETTLWQGHKWSIWWWQVNHKIEMFLLNRKIKSLEKKLNK